MSGGFFRGTSADQDTRFSNKQAKLLKSQKFPPELDHLVDMTKVKMDVIRPWIATRATELLGFEDEVLINFVYGLLDVKVVDGKKIQIQLTGFMEKNTSKFMKELWSLLLSAQSNVSGVPQQFLDAKEEEQRKMKEENDKISQEIQKRKERGGRDIEREKLARMEDEEANPKSYKVGTDILSRSRDSNAQPKEERKVDGHHSLKTRHSMSPSETNTSLPSRRSSPSAATSISKSDPSYGSHSNEGRKSRSPSVYSQSPRHYLSPRRRHHSPVRRSLTPVRKYRSPHRYPTSRSPIRRSPHSRRRSISRSRNRYSSPYWRRSHAHRFTYPHRRSPSPLHRRSPSPARRKSPTLRRRSPSLVQCRSDSPARRRSPTPLQSQRKTPSPFHRRSPVQRGSPSPERYRSISPIRTRSLLPLSSKYKQHSPPQSPVRRHAVYYNSPRQRNMSPSPHGSQSPLDRKNSHDAHTNFVNRVKSGRSYDERTERRLPVHHNLVKEPSSYVGSDKSPSHSNFQIGKMISLRKQSRSPVERRGGSISNHEGSETTREVEKTPHGRDDTNRKNDLSCKQTTYSEAERESSHVIDNIFDVVSLDRSTITQFPIARHPVKSEIQRSDMGDRKKGKGEYASQSPEDIEYGPGGAMGAINQFDDVKLFSGDRSPGGSGYKDHARRGDVPDAISYVQSISKGSEHEESGREREHGNRSKKKFDKALHLNSNYSDFDDTQDIDKRQHKMSNNSKRDINDNSETHSQINDKKEAKRKRKEDKRLRKEEKRRRHEERRRKRSERRATKQKLRNMGDLSPSDIERNLSEADESDGGAFQKKNSHRINVKETESEQKRLEMELRKKALESLRAKKAIND